MTTITVDSIVKAMAGIDLAKAPPEMTVVIESGRQALHELMGELAAEAEQRLQADVAMILYEAPMDALDGALEYVMDLVATELMQFTAVELAAITEETGGRTLARMRRAMAAEILKQRLA